jgi:outer membrane protein OmpU
VKKFLLAGSALAGGLCFAGAAQAQITVTLGGYTEFFGAYYDDDRPDRTDREFELETEVVIRADGKADNGLLYGTKIELQNSTIGDGDARGIGTDEASVYLAGTWGRLELGDFDGAADTLKIYAPLIGIEQIDGDFSDFTTADDVFGAPPAFGVHIPNAGDATKVMYLTPRIAGFQAGASYAPEFDSQAQNVVQSDVSTGDDLYEDFLEFGLNYTGEFAGFGVALGGTYSMADGKSGANVQDFTAWNAGGQVTFGGFAVGGGYVDADDFNAPADGSLTGDQTVWHAGVSYTIGPIAVAASYADAEGFKSNTVYASDYKSYGVGVAYTLAPGMVVQSDLMFIDEEVQSFDDTTGTTTTGSNDGYVFILGARLDF